MLDNNKKHLSINICNELKALAILLVLVGHFFGKADVLHGLHSVGFFGAALFAFLSGYGTTISYLNKGIPDIKLWLIKKFYRIYLPMVFVNTIQYFVYGGQGGWFLNIFWINNDGVLWYIPYVMVFNVLFGLLFYKTDNQVVSFLAMTMIGVVWFIITQRIGIASQWYTSTGALLLGMWFAKSELSLEVNNTMIGVTLVLALISIYLSKKFVGILLIKDLTTLLSGIFFCWFIEAIGRAIEEKTDIFSKRNYLSLIGRNSLWIYITHMLVLGYFTNTTPIFFLLFVLSALAVAIAFASVYGLFERGLVKILGKKV